MNVQEALARANGYWRAGQADQAEQICRQVLQSWPGQADALHLLGLMALAWGNIDSAADYLAQACSAPRAPATFHSDLAEILRQGGRLEEAEAAGRRAVSRDAGLAQAWNNLGIIQQERGKLEESRACLERALAMLPESPQAHSNLGNTLKKLGQLDQARRLYEAAIALDPEFADPHSNLAVVLDELGECELGLASAERAIEINPRLADAYVNAALIETRLGRYEAALWRLQGALVFAPHHPAALNARIEALQRLERYEEALEVCRLATAVAPDSGGALNLLGVTLQALGRSDEAMNAFERAAAFPPTADAAFNNKATLLMELGRKAEALAILDGVVERSPHFAAAWFNRADAKTFGPNDPDVAAMQQLLAPGTLQSHADRMCIEFALGKAHLDAGAAERALSHLHTANRMKRATFAYDPEATDRWMASIADQFSGSLLSKLAALSAGADQTPVFVLGMPRSGTSLIEQILASHPQVHGAGELSFIRQIADGVRAAPPYPGFATQLTAPMLSQMGAQYLRRLKGLAPDSTRIVDKMPSNFFYAGLIHLMLPGARIIHCRRDPIDTCFSCYTKMFRAEQMFAYDLTELGRFYLAYQRLMAHWRAVLPPHAFIEVDYEAVVGDLPAQARRLVEFCGLPWDEQVLRFDTTRRVVRTASMNQVRDPLDPSRVGRGRTYDRFLAPLLDALAPAHA